MAAYGDITRSEPAVDRLNGLLAITDRDELVVEAGEIAQGLIDAGVDERLPLALCLRGAEGGGAPLRAIIDELRSVGLPSRIESKTPEGFAFYAVYPAVYARAAAKVPRDGKRTVVVGIRTIGTSLGAVVAAAVHADEFFTVRPDGHPFDRHVDDPRLRDPSARYLVVDEGPGLSGSSFAAVASAAAGEVIFFPSHPNPPGPYSNDRVREIWSKTPRAYVDFDEYLHDTILPAVERIIGPVHLIEDIGAGKWRDLVEGARNVPVWTSHERRKYLINSSYLLKFAGVGRYGREKSERIRETSPRTLALVHGFLLTEWIEGARVVDLGRDRAALVETLHRHLRNDTDGRMHAWEWIVDRAGRVYKTDAVDHACGHDALGQQPVDWDIAGAAIELALDDDELPPYDHSYREKYASHQAEIFAQAAREVADAEEKRRLQKRADWYVTPKTP